MKDNFVTFRWNETKSTGVILKLCSLFVCLWDKPLGTTLHLLFWKRYDGCSSKPSELKTSFNCSKMTLHWVFVSLSRMSQLITDGAVVISKTCDSLFYLQPVSLVVTEESKMSGSVKRLCSFCNIKRETVSSISFVHHALDLWSFITAESSAFKLMLTFRETAMNAYPRGTL